MNNWIYSPKILSEVQKSLTVEAFKYVSFPRFVFLCGKAFDATVLGEYERTNRGVIEGYLLARSKNIFCVLSEKVWQKTLLEEIDLLTFEEVLAEVSDCIVLFVESMGSACELGAFTFEAEQFCRKLVIVLDRKYQTDESFINQGPVFKARKHGAHVIYTDFSKALLMDSAIRMKISEILDTLSKRAKRTINKKQNEVLLDVYMIEILEIIRLFQPVKSKDIVDIYKKIKNFSDFEFVKHNQKEFNVRIQPSYLLNVLEAAGIIEDSDGCCRIKIDDDELALMFSLSEKKRDQIRGRLLARLYKYGER